MKFGTSLKHWEQKNREHFPLVKNVCIAGKINWYLLAEHQQRTVTAGGWLLDEKPCGLWHSQRTPALFFFLHWFAFWERQLQYYKQESLKSTLSKVEKVKSTESISTFHAWDQTCSVRDFFIWIQKWNVFFWVIFFGVNTVNL